ncbi:MAG TPA: winged helix DNA-binding domain-containing protein, partial [Chitinophagaceae bacterium]|nr:winged helix DNA-binding domain-containing protein [Chitinophagaceae bacterium]
LMDAELDGVICSGPRQGKQFTYALLEERVPPAAAKSREEALTELARRYFSSRGPATLPDFAWWGGITLSDAKKGLEQCRQELAHEEINGQAYWFLPGAALLPASSPAVYLLPAYDEYAIGYKDRNDILSSKHTRQAGNGIFKPIIVSGGQIAGTWQRTLKKEAVEVELNAFDPLSATVQRRLKDAVKQYGKFLGKKVG